jgi:serine/threonine protein kinase
MELIEGACNLFEHWERLGKKAFTEPVALEIFRSIINVVIDLKENNIYHRDLKLENILLGRSGVKLIDFGFATESLDGKAPFNGGTPWYAAPEVI